MEWNGMECARPSYENEQTGKENMREREKERSLMGEGRDNEGRRSRAILLLLLPVIRSNTVLSGIRKSTTQFFSLSLSVPSRML